MTLFLCALAAAASPLLYRAYRQHLNARTLRLTSAEAICEAGFVTIGGLPQWLTVRGEHRANPILLVLHGGPGATTTSIAPRLRSWERHFTLAQWDQRGAGKTLGRNPGQGPTSFARLAEDGLEVVEHLCRTLGQEQVILLGSSVGSVLALHLLARRPARFRAYVGTDQNVGPDPDGLGFQAVLAAFRAAGNEKNTSAFEAFGADRSRWSLEDFDRRNRLITALPPDMISQVILPGLLTSPDHSLLDVLDVFRGLRLSQTQLFSELNTHDARALGLRFGHPFFIFQGSLDWHTPAVLARRYLDAVEAPVKAFELVEGAGHLAAFSHPERFLELLLVHLTA